MLGLETWSESIVLLDDILDSQVESTDQQTESS